MVYGRAAWLPIDFPEDSSMTNENDRLFALINQLPHIREKACTTVTRSQTKQKDWHDRKVRTPIKFQIGDKVLYFKITLDQLHSDKFDQKWKGLYYVHQVLPNGAYKIRTLEGQVLSAPINGNLLKMYHEFLYLYK